MKTHLKHVVISAAVVGSLWLSLSAIALPKQDGRVTGVGPVCYTPTTGWRYFSMQCFDWQTDAGSAVPDVVFCGGQAQADGGVANCGRPLAPPSTNGTVVKFSTNPDPWPVYRNISSGSTGDTRFCVNAIDAGSSNCVFARVCDPSTTSPSCP